MFETCRYKHQENGTNELTGNKSACELLLQMLLPVESRLEMPTSLPFGTVPNDKNNGQPTKSTKKHLYVPWSKVAILGMVIAPLIGILIMGI